MSTFLLLEVFAKLLSKIVIYKRGTGECSIPTPVIFIFSFNHWYFNKQSIFLCIWLSLHVRLAIMYLYASCDFCKAYDLLYMGYQASLEVFATPWPVAHQAPLSMGFPRPEYWSGSSCSPLQDIFPTQGSNPGLILLWQAGSLPLSHLGSPQRFRHKAVRADCTDMGSKWLGRDLSLVVSRKQGLGNWWVTEARGGWRSRVYRVWCSAVIHIPSGRESLGMRS